ncbi:hypothetical protein Peetri_00013 [Pseudomonas phage vB_PpuM-Peetri]
MNKNTFATGSLILLVTGFLLAGVATQASAAVIAPPVLQTNGNGPAPSANFARNEEMFCKKLGRVSFTAAQMREADATQEETTAAVSMLTATLRPDTREMMMYSVVNAVYEDAAKLTPEEISLNLFSNCMGRVDPATTYTQNGRPPVQQAPTKVSSTPVPITH